MVELLICCQQIVLDDQTGHPLQYQPSTSVETAGQHTHILMYKEWPVRDV